MATRKEARISDVWYYGVMTLLIDVRTPEEYAEGHIEGAVNITGDDLIEGNLRALMNLEQDAPIQLYCRSGGRAEAVKAQLQVIGFSNVTNLGGMQDAARAVL